MEIALCLRRDSHSCVWGVLKSNTAGFLSPSALEQERSRDQNTRTRPYTEVIPAKYLTESEDSSEPHKLNDSDAIRQNR